MAKAESFPEVSIGSECMVGHASPSPGLFVKKKAYFSHAKETKRGFKAKGGWVEMGVKVGLLLNSPDSCLYVP